MQKFSVRKNTDPKKQDFFSIEASYSTAKLKHQKQETIMKTEAVRDTIIFF